MKTLALLVLMSAPSFAASPPLAPVPSTGTVASAQMRLQAQDPAGALIDAEAALARARGASSVAEAYAARADAKLALGRPMDDAIADYGDAAGLDPRYMEKYKGLIVQRDSERNPKKGKSGGKLIDPGVNNLALIFGFTMIGGLIAVVSLVLLRGREAS